MITCYTADIEGASQMWRVVKRLNRHIAIQFAFAAVAIGLFAVLNFIYWSCLGMVLYLLFAALCMTPAVIALIKSASRRNIRA